MGARPVPMKTRIVHPFPPLYDEHSRILILGSFPSVKSREQLFFYGHPQNRFWKVLSSVLGCPVPQSIPEKRQMLLTHHVALWDSIGQCEIEGSSDASIEGVIPNDLSPIFTAAEIRQVFCNGKKSWETHRYAGCLPAVYQSGQRLLVSGAAISSLGRAYWTLALRKITESG